MEKTEGKRSSKMICKSHIYLSILLLTVSSCHKTNSKKRDPITYAGTRMIAHHAYLAPSDKLSNRNYFIQALKTHDGIEVDVQMSQDGTLWLYHNNQMSACGAIKQECLITKNDLEIKALAECENKTYSYTKLDDVLTKMEQDNDGKVISLDIKTWFDSKCSVYGNNITAYYHNIAFEIVSIVKKHNLEDRVMVESEIAYLLGKIRRNSSIACYLSAFGDYREGVRKALKFGYTGISFQYLFKESINKSDIEELHKEGLKIQLWVVNGDSLTETAKLLQPDYIQTDD
jgi:glycerophosphoryl diester phosphodiesterase